MEILKHRLVDGGVQHLVCRKNSRKLSGPDMIVVHYTAGTSACTAAEFLAKEEVKASALWSLAGRANCSSWCLSIRRPGTPGGVVMAGESEPLFHRHRVG